MRLNYIGTKYKIILKTTPLFQQQLTEFYSNVPRRAINVTFLNPYTGKNQTISAYRGDRKVTMLFDIDRVGRLYDAVEQSFIEL